ncbi:F-box protein pof7 [Cercospora beticola]|uniref:F-box protein pof7 n=1 Tax=Cercospora beticola TaxID=122368 RepID=A0A2G5HIN5_CERBT|nr:F-box protein pof7 [Cercospora beticola]PIA92426.1 F-box protein pof7 [Cercospora beticola]WPB05613.1 hypothetical protein RHO25_010266 [Cercospora beticola]
MSTNDRTLSNDAAPETEAELEAFRQQWREEVSARNKQSKAGPSRPNPVDTTKSKQTPAGPSQPVASGSALRNERFHEETAPKAYHDLPDKEEQLRLGEEGQELSRNVVAEPTSALEHYERAVEKETQGHLSESMRHYRKAFKLDDGVHEAYKRKHFPASSFQKPKPANPNPSNASSTVPRTDHHSLHGSAVGEGLPATLKQMVEQFSAMRIEPPEPETSLSPNERCPLAELPEELLTHILMDLAIDDVASFARLAQVCKRLAYLVLTEDSIWRQVAMSSKYGFPSMHYDFPVEIDGSPVDQNEQLAKYMASNAEDADEEIPMPPTPEERAVAFSALTDSLLVSHYSSSWRQMFRSRPRIRFNGCYISTVNYTRAGATSTNTLTWGAPVHVVTYFRYLRFLRDGSCISLLTTAEPADVVHHLTPENLHSEHYGNVQYVPSAVMKDALRGRWRLSGPASSQASHYDPTTGRFEDEEVEGDVLIETEGVVPKYTYHMFLGLAHAGKGARNNKLAWKGFWSWNRLTDDWARFELRNDKAFYWSRVKSYGDGV